MSTSAIEKVNGTQLPQTSHAESWARAGIADAEAEAIRARTAAEVEARRIQAEGEAEALRIKAREEAERQRIINERAAMKLAREKAENDAKVAEADRKRDEANRLAAEAKTKAAAEQQAKAEQGRAEETAAGRWRNAAIGFAIACGIVALPVQVSAFWNWDALWLAATPVFLEGGAWVVLAGAAAAVAARRPHWHFRLIAWALAFVAAGVNLWHGLAAFDTATACATAFASLAGPGVWDLHEHGRIRKRDGVLTRRERKEQERAEKRAAAEKVAAEKQARAEREAKEKASKAAADKLAADRAQLFPKVWDHAVKLAADLGEIDPNVVWKRAKRDIEGTDPGESVDIIRGRNIAERRVLAARSEAPGSTPVKAASSQLVPQVPARGKRGRVGGPPVRGVRRKGDTTFSPGARRQQSITARTAASEEQS